MNTNDKLDVTIERSQSNSDRYQASINDREHKRAWTGEGTTQGEAVGEAIDKFRSDRHAPEYIRKPGA